MWARASALTRHLNCAAASWLPRDERQEWVPGYLENPNGAMVPDSDMYPNQGDSVFAEWGTQMHLAKENSPFASDPWLGYVNPERSRLWPSLLGRHEIPYAYNCRTGRVLQGPSDGADSWKGRQGPDYITGTTDWVGNVPSGKDKAGDYWIDDLKTGHATPDPLSDQFKFYALCALRWANQEGLIDLNPRRTCRTSATHWPRSADKPTRYWSQITWAELEEFEDEIKRAWRNALRGPEAVPGTHCLYCSSMDVCEAINGVRKVQLKKARVASEDDNE